MKKNFILFVLFLFITMNSFGQYKTTANVHFRALPEFGKNIISTIPKGTVVAEVDMGMNYKPWTVVKYKGRVGFVYSDYVINNDTVASRTKEKKKNKIGFPTEILSKNTVQTKRDSTKKNLDINKKKDKIIPNEENFA